MKRAIPLLLCCFIILISLWEVAPTSLQAGAIDINLSQGKFYTVSATAPNAADQALDAVYPDSAGKELTDGILAGTANFWEAPYQGWYRQGSRIIVVDLGQISTVHQMKMRFLQDHTSGVYLPSQISAEISSDHLTWRPVGAVPALSISGKTNAWYTLSAVVQSGRYVRIVVPVNATIVFSDELQIWGQTGVQSDPPSTANLASAKSYNSKATYPDSMLAATEAAYPDSGSKELADGQLGTTSIWHAAWQGWQRQDSRQIVINLESASTVHRVRMHFLQDTQSAILFPKQVRYEISSDNMNWRPLGEVPTTIPRHQTGLTTQWYELTGLNHAGQYVRVTVPVDAWVFTDEIEVWGGSGIASGANVDAGTPDAHIDKGLPASDIRQILIYAGHDAAAPSFVQWTKADFKPYVGYVDRSGVVQDTMFNSFLFLPYEAKAQSGNNYIYDPPSNKADWQYLIDTFFTANLQIDALNQTVVDVRTATGLSGFTPAVYVAIPYPNPKQTRWGDLNGDGFVNDSDSFGQGTANQTALNNRIAAVKWYIDEVTSRFAAGNYNGLKLQGFYWLPEEINYSNGPAELEIIQSTADYVHNQGLQLEWIPYYQASGFRDWEHAGFDVALMQPNYMFDNVGPGRLGRTVDIARHYGMGVELELDGTMHIQTEREKYYRYLNAGVDNGYMTGTFLAWYDWVKVLGSLSSSIYLDLREVYDATYQFIHGTYVKKALP